MWFGTLPSLAIVGGTLCSINIFAYFTNKLFLGNPYKRALYSYDDAHHFLRDMRVSQVDSPYYQKRLETLPDEEDVHTETSNVKQ